jgi:hypothetical protein
MALCDRADDNDPLINKRLLKRLTEASFRCPGFTQAQKAEIAYVSNVDISGQLAPYAWDWTVFKTLGPKPRCELDVLNVSTSSIALGCL